MLAWMLYVNFITLLLGAAALAAERAAVLRRVRTRWIWILAILASLALPTIIASVSVQLPNILIPTVANKITALREMTAIHVAPLTWLREQSSQSPAMSSLNLMLPSFWAWASAGLFAVLVLNGAYVSWRSPHKQARLARHDQQVLTLALFMLAVMPWNLPLWWQLRRLRRAIDVDCDARVLERGLDPGKYRQMLTDVTRRGPVAAPMLVLLAFALVAVAAQVTPPNVGNPADGAPHTLMLAPEILDRYVGFYARWGHAVTEVSRRGSHLFTQGATWVPVELSAESETDFWVTNTQQGVHNTFLLDGRGRVTGLLEHSDRPKWELLSPRVDASTAQQIRAGNKVRFQSQSPMPGSEAALRRMIDGVLNGKCIDEVAPDLKRGCERTMRDLHWEQIYAGWGSVQSVKFLGVEGEGGMDVYEVRQERGRSEWSIYLDANGVIQDYDDQRTGRVPTG